MSNPVWFIEVSPQVYVRAAQSVFMLTSNPNEALQFAREQDADVAMMAIRTHEPGLFPSAFPTAPRATAHSFIERENKS